MGNAMQSPVESQHDWKCTHCGQPMVGDGIYCSRECGEKDKGDHTDFAKRLHDGSRLQSDDFGEEPGDDLVTYQ